MSTEKQMNFDIISFIIFDPTLCHNEEDGEKKILYCYFKTISLEQRLKTIGLCEAMCNFAKEFTSSPCQFIHTQKTRIVLYQLENKISIVMTVAIPKKTTGFKEYLDENIQNCVCETILRHCRQMFYLFMGPPSCILEKGGVENLKEKLTSFYDKYIANGMLDGYHITHSLPGVQLLPIDMDVHVEAKALIDNVESKFPFIKSSILLFNNHVVHYSVSKEDLVTLYRYITVSLLAKHNFNEAMNSSFTTVNMGKFIIGGPINPNPRGTGVSAQRLFLQTDEYLNKSIPDPVEVTVVVYKAVQSYIILFLKNAVYTNEEFNEIHNYLGPKLTKLNNSLSQKSAKYLTDTPYRYIYWNPETLSVKCTIFPFRQWISEFQPLVSPDTMRVIADVKEEFERHNKVKSQSIKEMAVKLQSDSWVIGIENNGRQLLVTISKRNVSLIEASKEVRQICNKDFPNVFKVDME